MNRRATLTLAILVFGVSIELSPARAQSQTAPQQITRPRTVTSPTTRQSTPEDSSVSKQPAMSSITASPQIGAAPQSRSLSMSKIHARLTEAQRLLKSRPSLTTMNTASTLWVVTLAVLDEKTSQIHLLTIPKETFLNKGTQFNSTTSLGMSVELRVIRANGVNTAVTVFDSTGRSLVPLIVEYPIERNGALREMAYYTSAHPALLSPEVVKAGQSYIRTMLDLAAKRLRDKGVSIPSNLIDIAERLCVVEHADHTRFFKENRKALFEEIFSLYALNELNTYRHSVSVAGAGGMVQMIPPTYQMLRRVHPGIGLNPDFVYGMRNHGNALEAMLLYVLDTWKLLASNPDVTDALSSGIATQPDLIAAGYNSNPARLGGYIRRGGAGWRTLIPRETQMYLQIYRSFESLIPMKPRS